MIFRYYVLALFVVKSQALDDQPDLSISKNPAFKVANDWESLRNAQETLIGGFISDILCDCKETAVPSLSEVPTVSAVPSLSNVPSLVPTATFSDVPSLSNLPSLAPSASFSDFPSISKVPSLAPSFFSDFPSNVPTAPRWLFSQELNSTIPLNQTLADTVDFVGFGKYASLETNFNGLVIGGTDSLSVYAYNAGTKMYEFDEAHALPYILDVSFNSYQSFAVLSDTDASPDYVLTGFMVNKKVWFFEVASTVDVASHYTGVRCHIDMCICTSIAEQANLYSFIDGVAVFQLTFLPTSLTLKKSNFVSGFGKTATIKHFEPDMFILIGAPDSDGGLVHLFSREGYSGNYEHKYSLQASDGEKVGNGWGTSLVSKVDPYATEVFFFGVGSSGTSSTGVEVYGVDNIDYNITSETFQDYITLLDDDDNLVEGVGFGSVLDIAQDGSHVFIGAPLFDDADAGTNSGLVSCYNVDVDTGLYKDYENFSLNGASEGDMMGRLILSSLKGDYFLVGDNSDRLFVYKNNF